MTDHTSPEGRAELRARAASVNLGESTACWYDAEGIRTALGGRLLVDQKGAEADAKWIEAASPAMVMALLDRIEELEQAKAPRLKLEAQLERAEARVAELEGRDR